MGLYQDLINSLSPEAYWRLGEASGTVAADETGNWDGTYAGSPTLEVDSLVIDDPTDTAVGFDGSNDKVTTSYNGTASAIITFVCSVVTDNISQVAFILGQGHEYREIQTAATGDIRLQNRVSGTVWDFDTNMVAGITYHLVVVFTDATLPKLFLDGVEVTASPVSVSTTPNSTTSLKLATRDTDANFFDGTLDEVAVYESALTDAQILDLFYTFRGTDEGDEFFDDVKLLIHCEGADASTSFFDSSSSEHVLTATGNAQVDTAFFKYGASSLLCDDNGDYISVADSADFNFGTAAFTIEGWVYPTTGDGTPLVNCQRTTNHFQLFLTSSTVAVLSYNNVSVITGITLTASAWQHVAIIRDGVDLFVMIDGVQQGSTYNIGTGTVDLSSVLGIGGGTVSTHSFAGNVDDIRITTNQARYTTTTFSPPTRAFSNFKKAAAGDADFGDVTLLINMDGYDTQTGFIDQSRSQQALTAIANVQVDTAITKWGTSSILLDGTTDYISVANSADFDFAANDFTIEGWIYPTAGGSPLINCQRTSNFFLFFLDSSTSARVLFSGSNVITGITTIASTWQHIAIVRNGVDLFVMVDGVQQGSTYDIGTTNIDCSSALGIGGGSVASHTFSGNVDDVRITNLAKYAKTGFTAPTAPFATYLVVIPDTTILQGTIAIAGQIPGQSIQTIVQQLELTLVGGKVEFAADRVKQGDVVVVGGVPGIILGFTGFAPQQGNIGWEGFPPGSAIIYPFQGIITVSGQTPGFGALVVNKATASSRSFIAVITGFNDGLPDIVVPISNMTTRNRADGTSTLTVTVPNGAEYSDDIAARPNGTVIVTDNVIYSDGTSESVEGEEYLIDTARSSEGGRSFSVVITARATLTNTAQKILFLKGVSLITLQSNGSKRVRSELDLSLRPGDVVTLPDDSTMQSDNITQVVSQSNMFMEVVSG